MFQLAQVLQIHQVFLEFLPGEKLEDGFFDEKTVLQPSLPAESFNSLGDGIIHFNGQSAFWLFHRAHIIRRLNNFVKKKLIIINFSLIPFAGFHGRKSVELQSAERLSRKDEI